MLSWFEWLTRLENSKVVSLLLFFALFCGILLYAYVGKSRSARLESYRFIPLQDDDDNHEASADRKVKKDGRGEDK